MSNSVRPRQRLLSQYSLYLTNEETGLKAIILPEDNFMKSNYIIQMNCGKYSIIRVIKNKTTS